MRDVRRGVLAVSLVVLLLLAGIGQAVSQSVNESRSHAGTTTDTSVDPIDGAEASTTKDRSTGVFEDASADAVTDGSTGTADRGIRYASADVASKGAVAARQSQEAVDDVIRVTQEFERLPEVPGEVTVRQRFAVPDRVVSLATQLPEEATVTDLDGFQRANETRFEWDERTDLATVTYRIPVNETIDRSGPEGAQGEYIYVDAGEWALFSRPQTPTEWRYVGRERVGYERSLQTRGPGATGEWIVFLGEHELERRTAHDQTFDLVVPAAADLNASSEGILDAMAATSDALRVGDRDDSVFVVAAPTESVAWGVRGLQTGDADVWVRDVERLDTADNVWLHEYVHTRQSHRLTPETRWFDEATATYYAALMSLEQDLVDFEAFRDRVAEGEDETFAEVVLSEPETWQGHANYYRGTLVAGDIDRELRASTDKERTLQDVLRDMNGQQELVDQPAFLATLETYGGSAVRDHGRNLTTGTTRVEMWNRSVHDAAFGRAPARVGYTMFDVENSGAYRVSGAYRIGPVGGGEPIRLVTGETLTVDALVQNAGGTDGEYNVTLSVNESIVDRRTGTIPARENRTIALSHTFAETGLYRVGLDGDNVTVRVERPARATVRSVSANRTDVQLSDTVTVSAFVVNDNDRPARTTVTFRQDGERVARREAHVGPYGTDEVAARIRMTEVGVYEFSAGSAEPVTVNVEPTTPATTTTTTTTTDEPMGDDGGGFGPVVGIVAILAGAGAWILRRS